MILNYNTQGCMCSYDTFNFRIILTIVTIKNNNLKIWAGYGECDFLLYSTEDHVYNTF